MKKKSKINLFSNDQHSNLARSTINYFRDLPQITRVARIKKRSCARYDVNFKIAAVLPPEIVYVNNVTDQRTDTAQELFYEPSAYVNTTSKTMSNT